LKIDAFKIVRLFLRFLSLFLDLSFSARRARHFMIRGAPRTTEAEWRHDREDLTSLRHFATKPAWKCCLRLKLTGKRPQHPKRDFLSGSFYL